jgi:MoaA/NifB/PqqE/SkfB family radical SAM enzyme
MDKLQEKQIIFGASVTVTKDNLVEVTNDQFLNLLYEQGCKVVIYVEYVPIDEKTSDLALGDRERDYLNYRLSELRNVQDGMVFISFPGDEKTSGGCLAAGRGFFHINASGGAEPCPFSPYSDVSVRTEGIRKSLQSTLFCKLQSEEIILADHVGGCVLFEQKNQVETILLTGKKL